MSERSEQARRRMSRWLTVGIIIAVVALAAMAVVLHG